MQRFFAAVLLATLKQAQCSSVSPIAKVINMLSDLEAKITAEGEIAKKEYAQFTEWCEDRSRNLGFEIKTGTSEAEELNAAIAQEVATSLSLSTQVDELTASVATSTADLKAAAQIRGKEAADFAAEEKELMETIDTLKRAITILQREVKGGASMLQVRNFVNLAQAMSALVQASVISTSDASHLSAFIQSSQQSSDAEGDEEPGAPAGRVYESHSGDIVDTLDNLLEKAEVQLDATRSKEVDATHNYEMLKQSLADEIAVDNKELEEAKEGIAASAGKKSTADGDLGVTAKELASDKATKETLHQDCMEAAEEYQASSASRAAELKVLAQAQKTIQEATGSALDQVSLLQESSLASRENMANFEAVHLIRDLARQQHSQVLAQLAARMASVMQGGSADPFGKVKGLITDMIAQLEAKAGADATKKAYCDKELKETNAKKAEKTAEIEALTTRIDQQASKSAKLKEQVSQLESELSKLASSKAAMDKLRQEEKDTYTAGRAEQMKGLDGVRLAIKLLKDYYSSDAAHDAATGAATGIIGLLEVIESDFTKAIASMDSQEEAAAAEYETMTKENQIDQTAKEQSVKYKVQDSKQLDKSSSENSADRNGVQAELDAIVEYLRNIEAQCIAKAESYSDRAAHRDAEIAGLKQALSILENETALIQRLKKHRTLRAGFLRPAQQ